MTVHALLRRLSDRGVELWLEGERLRYGAVRGALDERLAQEIKARRSEVVAELMAAPDLAAVHPLSHGQRALWFLYQLAPESPAYNIVFGGSLPKDVDRAVFERAFDLVVRRHGILRTTYALEDGEPVQRVHWRHQVRLVSIETGDDWNQRRFDTWLAAECDRPFDLENGPVLRAHLVRSPDLRPDPRYLLVLVAHHIAFDFWSAEILLNELRALYAALGDRPSTTLTFPAPAYRNHVAWQQELLAGPEGERLEAWWLETLEGEKPVLELPADRPRPAVQSYDGAAHGFAFGARLSRRLRSLAREHGTPFVVVLAALQTLLGCWSGRRRLLLGTPTAGRDRTELETMLGYFVNPIVVPGDLSGDPTFEELLRRSKRAFLGALDHQEYPFPLLVERLQPERDPARSPLFQVELVWDRPRRRVDAEERGKAAGELMIEPFLIRQQGAELDLSLTIFDTEDVLFGSWRYSTALFDATTVGRLSSGLLTLLKAAVEAPQRRLSELPRLDRAQRHQLLLEWNDGTQVVPLPTVPTEATFHRLFELQAARSGDAPALVEGLRRLSYRELNAAANRLARQLVEHGAELVALYAPRGVDFVTAMISTLKAGGAFLPLDPRHPAPRLQQVLERSAASVVLVGAPFAGVLAEARAAMDPGRRPRVLELESLLATPGPETNLPARGTAHDLSYVIFTSGSTGVPKGAMIEHRGMLNHLFAKIEDLALGAGDVVAQTAPQSFDISVWQSLVTLLLGGRVEVFADEVTRDPERLLAAVAAQGITILEVVPAMLGLMLEELEAADERPVEAADERPVEAADERPELSSLRWLMVTGEALPPASCRRWLALHPEIPLINAYGPTECSDDITHHAIRRPPPTELVNMPIGRPVLNFRLHLLDSDLAPVPLGVHGEVCAGGVGVGRGYLGAPRLTAMAFVPDPFSADPGARLYRTGDLGRQDGDGTITFLGRIDDQVKVRGFRIELGEIERALEAAPEVERAVVLTAADPGKSAGSAEQRLVACMTAAGGWEISTASLRENLRRQLPDYMVPATFTVLDTWPLNANGKIDRSALSRLAESTPGALPAAARVAPGTDLEHRVAGFWQDALGLEEVGVEESFFDLGGHSLLLYQVHRQVRKVFGDAVSLVEMFMYPTVRSLAEHLERVSAGEAAPSNDDDLGAKIHAGQKRLAAQLARRQLAEGVADGR